MEGSVTEESPPFAEKDDNPKESESAVNFQTFIYDLFEKNGILSDLRAYLRGHIVDVLKGAQTGGGPPACQKHFTQRLELTYQALNILVAEYLLRLEFSYSLSVFVSEIPLANMVFSFAKKLMLHNNGDFEGLRFKENDVWAILNYLGVKCDSEHASQIVEMYSNNENLPLLSCILKCMPMYPKETYLGNNAVSSSESLSSSTGSIDIPQNKPLKRPSKNFSANEKCKHYVFCKTCQAKMSRLKKKYKMKKKHLIKNIKSCEMNSLNVETLMRNVDVMEKTLVDEMFQQLKSVYESEVEMMKKEGDNKIKRSLASHALQLQKRKDEMEESFKVREAELESNAQEKKKFLWGIARALRDQHAAMTRAMHAARSEADRLTAKEDSLKSQLVEAEEVLRKRGEEMRKQISNELLILEEHLESMKREREKINEERAELENLKIDCNSSRVIKVHDLNNEELRSHYDLLKDELSILKKYLESSRLEPKCVIERSTLTELNDVSSKIHMVLNNGHDVERIPLRTDSEERLKTSNKVVNDFKKQKNVNFCASSVDEIYRSRSRSRASSVADGEDLERLREENERLKNFARQQRSHIDSLTSHQARLQAELTATRFRAADCARPRTAPAAALREPVARLNTSVSVNSVGWRIGAGEEISLFSNAHPRVILPGDTIPFVGVLRDRNNENRRHLIDQWRALRSRVPPRDQRCANRPAIANPTIATNPYTKDPQKPTMMNEPFIFEALPVTREKPNTETRHRVIETHKPRERSSKPVEREAKEVLRTKSHVKEHATTSRDKSPNAVLREAKLRLRKLEIEAEAVEKSYLEFRKRNALSKGALPSKEPETIVNDIIGNIDILRTRSHHRLEENDQVEDIPHFTINHDRETIKNDFDRYLREYQNKFSAGASHFRNASNPIHKTKPIPAIYSKIDTDEETQGRKDNYLETPLTEFRKLYRSQRSPPVPIPEAPTNKPRAKSPEIIPEIIPDEPKSSGRESPESRSKSIKSLKTRKDQLEILKDNFSKMYNLQDENEIDQKIVGVIAKSETPDDLKAKDETSLRVEVENVSEANSLGITESNTRGDLLLLVESSIDSREIDKSECELQQEPIPTAMTVLVSPKRIPPIATNLTCREKSPTKTERSVSPEQAAHLTRNDVLDAIFHADANKRQSSIEMDLDISKDLIEDSISDLEKVGDEYPDDFSADVDNYNSRSDYDDNLSPISLPKNSEDENFWES